MPLTALQIAQRDLRIFEMSQAGSDREKIASALGLPIHTVARVVQSFRDDLFDAEVSDGDIRSGLQRMFHFYLYRNVPDRSKMEPDEALDYDEMVDAIKRFSKRYYIHQPQRAVIREIEAHHKREIKAVLDKSDIDKQKRPDIARKLLEIAGAMIRPDPPGFSKQTCIE